MGFGFRVLAFRFRVHKGFKVLGFRAPETGCWRLEFRLLGFWASWLRGLGGFRVKVLWAEDFRVVGLRARNLSCWVWCSGFTIEGLGWVKGLGFKGCSLGSDLSSPSRRPNAPEYRNVNPQL